MRQASPAVDWGHVAGLCAGELREGARLAELIARDLTDELRAAIGSLGLVVLRPDSLAAGQGVAILDRLQADQGAGPVALRLQVVSPFLVDALYKRQDKIPRDSLWLHHAVFASGPSALVLVAAAGGSDPGLTERLYARKGSTSPGADGDRMTLRGEFGRTSSFHAVVHVPADTAAFLIESTLFFPWDRLLDAARRVVETRGSPSLPGAWWRELLALEPRPGRVVFQAILKIKRRAVASLLVRDGTPPPPLRRLWDLMEVADRELEGLDYAAQRLRFLAFAEAERGQAGAAIAAYRERLGIDLSAPPAPGPPEQQWRLLRERTAPLALLYASWFLSGQEPLSADGGETLLATLRGHDVPLSPLQETLVAAALRADLNPDARPHGPRLYPLAAWEPS